VVTRKPLPEQISKGQIPSCQNVEQPTPCPSVNEITGGEVMVTVVKTFMVTVCWAEPVALEAVSVTVVVPPTAPEAGE